MSDKHTCCYCGHQTAKVWNHTPHKFHRDRNLCARIVKRDRGLTDADLYALDASGELPFPTTTHA